MMNFNWKALAGVCVLVIGVYAYMVESGPLEQVSPDAAVAYYNLLVQGFRAGQLNLKKEVPPAFAQLADPYDPAANMPYWAPPSRLLDLSYYHGKLYMYWGVTPALILFWPYAALTGRYLFHSQAVVIFCAIGFLASVGLLYGIWRRYFAEVSVGVVAACALALGLATGVPLLLPSADIYEVSISCGYMLTMLALGALWRAWHEPESRKRSGWLAAASVAYGLAVGARPTLLFGAVILLAPVVITWRERRSRNLLGLLAALGPIALVGLGLMIYNYQRFGSPLELGQHYQLAGERQVTRQFFRLDYLWFNFRVYFLAPAHWSVRTPYVRGITVPPLPSGYAQVRNPFGILTSIPVVWLALAVPLAWRGRVGEAASVLRGFVTMVSVLFGICAVTLGLYESAAIRYQVDFLPALLLLTVIGILGLERARPGWPKVWRQAARWGWCLLLGVSVAFNLLASGEYYAEAHVNAGDILLKNGKPSEAVEEFQKALWIKPDYAKAHNDFAQALWQLGRPEEAMDHWEQTLRIEPDNVEAHNNLGVALQERGRIREAIGHYEQVLRFMPDSVEAHDNLGVALEIAGRIEEAIGHYEAAVRIDPDSAAVHQNFGIALLRLGRLPEAVEQFTQALRIKPDYAEAHCGMGYALVRLNRGAEAIKHFQEAVRISPDYTEARAALARLQAGQ